MNALTAFGFLVLLAKTIMSAGLASVWKVAEPTAWAKIDRLAEGNDYARQVWPNFDPVCLRNSESGAILRAVRVVNAPRF
jgi:hypothetical protein